MALLREKLLKVMDDIDASDVSESVAQTALRLAALNPGQRHPVPSAVRDLSK